MVHSIGLPPCKYVAQLKLRSYIYIGKWYPPHPGGGGGGEEITVLGRISPKITVLQPRLLLHSDGARIEQTRAPRKPRNDRSQPWSPESDFYQLPISRSVVFRVKFPPRYDNGGAKQGVSCRRRGYYRNSNVLEIAQLPRRPTSRRTNLKRYRFPNCTICSVSYKKTDNSRSHLSCGSSQFYQYSTT